MAMCTVSSKGQITLPVRVRKELGIRPRDLLMVESADGTIVITRAPRLLDYEGCLAKTLPLREERERMARGVADHVLGKRA